MVESRRGPYGVEIRRGSWEERLAALIEEERARDPARRKVALVVEGRPEAAALAPLLLPHLGPEVVRLDGPPGLLALSEVLPQVLAAEAATPLLLVAIVGTGNRKDGGKASWALGPLTERLFVFLHDATPPSGLVPTVGEHVRRYLDVIEGLAFMEGPKRSR